MQESVGVSTRIGSKLGGEMERSQELEDLVRAWFGAASKGDASLIDRHVSRDPGTRLIGSDPNEWLDGEEIAGFLRGEAENAAGNATFGSVPSSGSNRGFGTYGRRRNANQSWPLRSTPASSRGARPLWPFR